jgi:hypothetical protein
MKIKNVLLFILLVLGACNSDQWECLTIPSPKSEEVIILSSPQQEESFDMAQPAFYTGTIVKVSAPSSKKHHSKVKVRKEYNYDFELKELIRRDNEARDPLNRLIRRTDLAEKEHQKFLTLSEFIISRVPYPYPITDIVNKAKAAQKEREAERQLNEK